VLLYALFAMMSQPAFNQQTDADVEEASRTFVGRPVVSVVGATFITDHSPERLRALRADEIPGGLAEKALQDMAELVLRRNGIPVVAECQDINCGRLVIMLRATCDKPLGICAAFYKVEYRDVVFPIRRESEKANKEAYQFSEVWATEGDGVRLITKSMLVESARKNLTEELEEFALAYLKANPVR
jgi:hypothetical protein